MEIQTSHLDHHREDHQGPIEMPSNYHSNVDTSRPFRSVKEAVAIFGERFLAGDIYAPRTFSFPKKETPVCFYTPSPSPRNSREIAPWKLVDSSNDHSNLAETLKKLETELEETKLELKKLKERESETEVALASLNAELHKNMSKLAQAEAAAAAAKAAMNPRITSAVPDRNRHQDHGISEDGRRSDMLVRVESSPTLAQMLSTTAADKEGWFEANFKVNKEKRVMKKKPIIPLIGDLFSSKKKGSSTSVVNPLYAASHLRLN